MPLHRRLSDLSVLVKDREGLLEDSDDAEDVVTKGSGGREERDVEEDEAGDREVR